MNTMFLYVKLSPKGLFYLGKTEKNPYTYLGSGLIWKRHLKKHNYKSDDIKTFILHETSNKGEMEKMGVYYSKLFNIVESKQWANLRVECGDGGDTSKCSNWKPFPIMKGDLNWTRKPESKLFLSERMRGDKNPAKREDVKEKIRQKALGRKATLETREKMSDGRKGEKNAFFNKKHLDVTKDIMKKKSVGRYTLNWFIEKYGEPLGKKMYDEKLIRDKENLNKGRNIPRKEYTCPHCGLKGKGGNMKRYHFNNCGNFTKINLVV